MDRMRRLLRFLDREACAHSLLTVAVTWSLTIWLSTLAEFVRMERFDAPVPMTGANLARAERTNMPEPAALVSRTNLIETGGGVSQKLERSGAAPGV